MNDINLYGKDKPHAGQIEIHRMSGKKSKVRYIIVCAGRQSGKTRSIVCQAIYWAITTPGAKIWWVAPKEMQAKVPHNDIIRLCTNMGIIKQHAKSSGEIYIEFINGAKIEFKSAQSEDSLRGPSLDYLIVDEAAFVKDGIFETILDPMLSIQGKKCIIASTPKGKNWFFKWYKHGNEKGQGLVKSTHFTSEINPRKDQEWLNAFRERNPYELYQQEIMGEFVDSTNVFRNIQDCCVLPVQLNPIPGEKYYAGLDIGMLKDETVLSIISQKGHLVYTCAFKGFEFSVMRDILEAEIKNWNPVKTFIEENNQGLPMMNELNRIGCNVTGFLTTNRSKEEIINNLIAAFSSQEIKCIQNKELIKQLEGFCWELTPTKQIRYNAASGFHDDYVLSLAFAYFAYMQLQHHGGKTTVIIPGDRRSDYKPQSQSRLRMKSTDIWFPGMEDDSERRRESGENYF